MERASDSSGRDATQIDRDDVDLGRRRFLQAGVIVAASSFYGCASNLLPRPPGQQDAPSSWPKFLIARPQDRLYLNVEAPGFQLRRGWRGPYLYCSNTLAERFLIFTFPPQHFAETTVPIQNLADPRILERSLDAIGLSPAADSRLVFRVPAEIESIPLSFEGLLEWNRFQLVAPDLEALKVHLAEEGKPYFVGLDWAKRKESAVELPWGIYLQPLGKSGEDYLWKHSVQATASSGYYPLWITLVVNRFGRHLPVDFEVLDVRGLSYKSYDQTVHRAFYEDSSDYPPSLECSPITNWDRLEIAGSLSRRFPYGSKSDPLVELIYGEPDPGGPGTSCAARTHACYVDNRSVQVYTYGLSALGGYLRLEAAWPPEPGCALKGWTHSTSSGQDDFVELERQGWLYPFGIPAELVVLSERQFVRDLAHHFVAPLVKQAFIRIAQPNELHVGHLETAFPSLSIATDRTPPLDPPPSGNVSDLAQCDYFLPMVDGVPVEFVLVGQDHSGNAAESRLPMYFVSNNALRKDGLLAEPRHKGADTIPCLPGRRPPKNSVCILPSTIPNATCLSFPPADDLTRTGGLWALDVEWQSKSYRFAQYGSKAISIASPSKPGNTTQEVVWIEWVRGEQPTLVDGVAPRPFQARARMMKLALHGMRQFSAQRSFVLATFRNLQFSCFPILDPEPAHNPRYRENILDPNSSGDPAEVYLQVLALPGGVTSSGDAPLPRGGLERASAYNTPERLERIRQVYFGKAGMALPASLFTDLDNEMRFGFEATTESLGGLATPDSPIGLLTRVYGPLGDSTFDPATQREEGAKPVPSDRLDYMAYRLVNRLNNTQAPFDDTTKLSATCSAEMAALLVGRVGALPGAAVNQGGFPQVGGVGSLASMFGVDAEILPGIRLAKVFETTGISFGGAAVGSQAGATDEMVAEPLRWDYKVTGADPLLELFGDSPGQIPLSKASELFGNLTKGYEPGEPINFGIEARLDWQTNSLGKVDLGIITFRPERSGNQSRFSVHASARVDFLGGKPAVEATANLRDFTISVFDSLDVEFLSILFALDSNGRKSLVPAIGEIKFRRALAFIENLKTLLKGLEDQLGIDVAVSPQRIEISQKLAIPPSSPGREGGTFTIGPALIENLYFRWGITIPILERSVLAVHFGLASREDPFTITVPPWGGRAHVLIEATTQGMRLFEASLEYGGMLRAKYSIAEGELSLMAGIFFQVAPNSFTLMAYVKLVGTLDVAKVITFNGLIQITLTDQQGGTGEKLTGEALVKVSVKIGFIRYSYSFSAHHEETRSQGGPKTAAIMETTNALAQLGQPPASILVLTTEIVAAQMASKRLCLCEPKVLKTHHFKPFELIEKAEWSRFVKKYAY